MRCISLLVIVIVNAACGQAIKPDLPILLNQISTICGDRWNVAVGDGSQIFLTSKAKALGEAPGYNFGPGEEPYTLHFRFKVVKAVEKKAAEQAKLNLKELRQKGDKISHRVTMGRYSYFPKGEKEWALVLAIARAETTVEDIPEYRFRSVYLSEEYTMDFFVPNKTDTKAVQYKKDIEALYSLLEKTSL